MIYYEKIYDDNHLGAFTESEELAKQMGWLENILDNTETEKSELNGWTYLKGYAPKKSDAEIAQEQIQAITNAVQTHLDKAVQTLNYDNGFACASYATSGNPKFRAEAQSYVKWRDEVWARCYALLDDYQAGKIEMPTTDEVIAMLPEFVVES